MFLCSVPEHTAIHLLLPQALPMMGGRSGCQDAAAVIEALCVGPTLMPVTGGGKDKGGKDKGAAADTAPDRGLLDAMQQAILSAQGLQGLVQVSDSVPQL